MILFSFKLGVKTWKLQLSIHVTKNLLVYIGCRGKGWDFVYAVKIYSE